MGKQIRFFMSPIDEHDFLRYVLENESLVLNKKGCLLTTENIQVSKELSLFIALTNSRLSKDANGFVDAIVAEVIQYSRCMIFEEKQLRSGRIWGNFKYYNSNQELITKSKEFSDVYMKYEKWIKKNFKPSKCKDYYIGCDAYLKYKERGYVLLAGPKHIVDFE